MRLPGVFDAIDDEFDAFAPDDNDDDDDDELRCCDLRIYIFDTKSKIKENVTTVQQKCLQSDSFPSTTRHHRQTQTRCLATN